jgi:hypothetical protein
MRYEHLVDFMYDAGRDVGEFLHDEEKDLYAPKSLPQIVSDYIDERSVLNVFFLNWDIKAYIKRHMTPAGLAYAYPFDYDLAFPERYFDGDLHVFLTRILALSKIEVKARVRGWLPF